MVKFCREMNDFPKSRRLYRRAERSAFRPCGRSVVVSRTRSRLRSVWRTVIPYDGPSLNDICALLSGYIRLATAHEKRTRPSSADRFQPLCSAEESRRKFEADLQRCYGTPADLGSTGGPPVSFGDPLDAMEPGVRSNQDILAKQERSAAGTGKSCAPASEKKDLVAVPLVRTADGCLGLNWQQAR